MEIELWTKVAGYSGYEISSCGGVRSYWRRTGEPGSTFDKWRWRITDKAKTLKQTINRDGYHMVRLQCVDGKQKLISVHKLMLESFVGMRPSPLYDACHKDDNKDRNVLDNLEWNTKHKNLQSRFINHGGPKLSKCDIEGIRCLVGGGLSQSSVAKQFKITQSHVSRIMSRHCWHYV